MKQIKYTRVIASGLLLAILLTATLLHGCASPMTDTEQTVIVVETGSKKWELDNGFLFRVEDDKYGVVCYVHDEYRGGDLVCFTEQELKGGR